MGDGLAPLALGAGAKKARADIAADKLHTRATGTLPLNRELAGWEATEEPAAAQQRSRSAAGTRPTTDAVDRLRPATSRPSRT